MVKIIMREIEDTTKRMEGENSLIEMKYRTTTCNDCGLKPATYFIVKGYTDYTNSLLYLLTLLLTLLLIDYTYFTTS